MSNENSEKITYKMIIIGDSAVGKTCIFKKITTGTFSEKSISTIGMDRRTLSFTIKNKEGNDLEIEVQLWDTAGQERFRSITTSYYKSSQGLLLMYDITKRETFDNIENWLQNIKDSIGAEEKYLIVLIGNKVDLANADPDSRTVTNEEAENLCKQNNIFWGGECSAKDFTEEQLKDIFTNYTQEIYKKVGVNISKGQVVTKPDKPRKSKC
jgi:Ras-related protein Rab-1A